MQIRTCVCIVYGVCVRDTERKYARLHVQVKAHLRTISSPRNKKEQGTEAGSLNRGNGQKACKMSQDNSPGQNVDPCHMLHVYMP